GTIQLSSTGAAADTVNVEGEIRNPTPSLIVSKDSIEGFYHFVGNPSEADSFLVEGFYLTSNLDITAPTNFEVSTDNSTYSSSVSLTPTGGSVASTKIYVRLNGSTK